eukprot:m.1639419 g.1639419  ORF g.1639419 m.1639419 type:complete len:407 (+) comp35324_c0_seq1:178-1398(+)
MSSLYGRMSLVIFAATFCLEFAVTCSSNVNTTALFVPSTRYPCWRQPAIVSLGEGRQTILAFAENRNVSQCAPPISRTHVVSYPKVAHPDEVGSFHFRRSVDGGKSWEALSTSLYVGNIDFYTATVAADGKTVYIVLEAGGNVVIKSEDAGTTWSTASTSLAVRGVPADVKSIKPSVGHGVIVSPALCSGGACANAGRMVVPMVCTNASVEYPALVGGDKGACPACVACLIVSDDNGKTWTFGGTGPAGSRESEVAQIPSTSTGARFYMTARNMGPTPGHRYNATCTDGGMVCGQFGIDSGLVSPDTPHWTGIVDGVVAVRTEGGQNLLVLSGAANPTQRAQMTVRTSVTSGATWDHSEVVWPGPAGYADVAAIGTKGKTVAVIFENGDSSFADRVSVATITLPLQ